MHCREDIEGDNVDFRHFTRAAAVATVMGKLFGLRSPHSSALLDRCPTFVSKDKSLKAKLIGRSRKVMQFFLSFSLCNMILLSGDFKIAGRIINKARFVGDTTIIAKHKKNFKIW